MGIEKGGKNEREKGGERGKEGELCPTRNRTLAAPLVKRGWPAIARVRYS